jgi:ABC-type multidrug transport system fused ATPase/permease subunit
VDLILRFYDPVQGSIEVDGVDLKDLDLTSWRRSIGVVSQDIYLFNETIAYNIGVGRTDANIEQIVEAAKQAYAHDFIQQLADGYETKIGDRGWNLSGGQRQRIALARAILKRPEILILDEATSSLDSESEQLIQDYMKEIRNSCTMIVVAHRTSTIQDADKIVVLLDGVIAEEGDWDTLSAGSGLLANYHRLQIGE